ncbi:MAG: 4Fe-4S binding protein [Alphaproteobacteria bacterium]|jgi:2-oxoglutarate ferredoxin oxidoreductase subunit delta|nr:4Fe-4S binding protein [Alphaproteobacteria bacterium]
MARARGSITIDEERCKGCDICVEYCPPHVLRLSDQRNSLNHLVVELFDEANCTGCEICARVCPDMAITQVFREILAA